MSFVQPRASHRNLAGSCDGAHGSPFLGVLPVCSALRTCLGPGGVGRGVSVREARGEGARRLSPAFPGRPAPLRWSGAGRRRTVREHAVLGEGSVHGLTEDHDEVHAGSVAVRGAQVGVHLVSSREVPWGEVQQVAAAPTRARLVRLQSGAHLVGGSKVGALPAHYAVWPRLGQCRGVSSSSKLRLRRSPRPHLSSPVNRKFESKKESSLSWRQHTPGLAVRQECTLVVPAFGWPSSTIVGLAGPIYDSWSGPRRVGAARV